VRTFGQWWASIVACVGEHPEQRDAVTAQIQLLLLMIEDADPEAPAADVDAGPCDETVAWAVQFLDLATMTARGAPEPRARLEGTQRP
jgi:hypothetical protein